MSTNEPSSQESHASEQPTPSQSHSNLSLILRGAGIGIAEAIPGVSGGTVALILGVYRRLIEAIRSYHPASVLVFLKALPGLWQNERRNALAAAAKNVHLDFLIPLAIGMLPAVLIGTKVLPNLMDTYRAQMYALFFGMILVSTWVPFRMLTHKSIRLLPFLIIGGVAAFVLVGFSLSVEPSAPFIFFCGAIAICAMILPGVSGSYILQALGQYKYISNALHTMDVATVATFLAGLVLGITIFVRVLSWLLRKYEAYTLATLIGLMFGSLRSVWPFTTPTGSFIEKKGKKIEILANTWPEQWTGFELGVVGFAIIGMVVVIGLIVVDDKLSKSH